MPEKKPTLPPEDLLEFVMGTTEFLDEMKTQADAKAVAKANTPESPSHDRTVYFATDEVRNSEAHRALTEMDKLVKKLTKEMKEDDDAR
ncbi:hypothetical protein [Tsukamurella pulmonis]|uniref:hypothetical protein n=1 Tax=Tsukamurella pulmonis TaxID=47312 RepID=UPI000E09D346|nr:hypothetical protein [Tsukamurella pulmonis]RDH11548.1 hypothetical protein DVB88_12185 [Tsukamurella pulmonis]